RMVFAGRVGGNGDVYVLSAAGGDPARLTFHPSLDRVRGWSPDGKRVIFASNRTSAPHNSYFSLWSVPVDGGFPEPLPMPRAYAGVYRSEEHTSELQSLTNLVCRLLLET